MRAVARRTIEPLPVQQIPGIAAPRTTQLVAFFLGILRRELLLDFCGHCMLGISLLINQSDQGFLKIDLGNELLSLAQKNSQSRLLRLRALGGRLGQVILNVPIDLLLLALEPENIEPGRFLWQNTANFVPRFVA